MGEILNTPGGLAGAAATTALIVRLLMWAAKRTELLEKVPKEVRPFVPLLLAAALAGAEHLASGGGGSRALELALLAFTGSEVTFRAQRGRQKRLGSRGSLSLGGG